MSLSTNYTFFGHGNWSLDAVGGSATNGGVLSAIVPENSTIQRAFLYASTFGTGASPSSVTLTFGATSTTITTDDYVALGTTNGGSAGLIQAFRTDITDFATDIIGNGDANVFDILASGVTGRGTDGFVLALVYANDAEKERTITLLDGVSATDGDDFSLSFADPVNPGPDYSALLSLGIGFGFQGSGQFSNVSVNDRPLTGAAGGSDDGVAADGGLITVGGIGDSAANPDDPTAGPTGPTSDDELYDLAQGNAGDGTPFLPAGTTTITVSTVNPSDNDNIFFAGFNITDRVIVDTGQNDAPVAVADSGPGFTTDEATPFTTASVLANDFDPENDAITVTGVDTSGLVGILVDNGDGTFDYDPDGQFDALAAGEEAKTSFSYAISDGEKSTTATVTITVTGTGDGDPDLPDCPVLLRPGTQNGSSSADTTLTGPDYHNSFYFDNGGNSGNDRITNFQAVDVIVTDRALRDTNGDGIIGFGRNGVLDLGSGDGGSIAIDGVTSLRILGEGCEDTYVYGAAYVRPEGAQEGRVLADDLLSGDADGTRDDVFFFDTALDLVLGNDRIDGFGGGDLLVTTTQIADRNGDGIIGFGPDALLDLPGGAGGPGDPGAAGEGGTVSITDTSGAVVTALEYSGSTTMNGVTYYLYGLVGSAPETLG